MVALIRVFAEHGLGHRARLRLVEAATGGYEVGLSGGAIVPRRFLPVGICNSTIRLAASPVLRRILVDLTSPSRDNGLCPPTVGLSMQTHI